MSKVRQKILNHISQNIGWRLSNVERGTCSVVDKELVNEALGFRSLCLFSVLPDQELKRLWDKNNLEYSL